MTLPVCQGFTCSRVVGSYVFLSLTKAEMFLQLIVLRRCIKDLCFQQRRYRVKKKWVMGLNQKSALSPSNFRGRSLNMGGGGAAYFFASFEGGAAQFFARTVGGATYFSQENLKIECTIDQINCNINRQIVSSNSYLKKFSGPPIMFLVFHVCSHFRRHLFHSFNLICYDHFSEWMNEA